jgi:glyoxylase-like metal-dependent hydrolase (beta-lactamase superfamily II)/rhodanese-related sulfurtransferase
MITSPPTIAPSELLACIADGTELTVLDVREDASWTIGGPGITVRHVPSPLVDAAAIARDLEAVSNRRNTAHSVAAALRGSGVNATALNGGMRGWIATLVAHTVELGIPRLEVRQIQRPARGCLSYLVAAGGHALVVDPAPDAEFYVALADELGVRISDVVDTHLHADHLSGARVLAERAAATLRLPAGALERGVAYPVAALRDGDVIDLGGFAVRALALPGHTSDMTGLVVAERALIAGDSLFADGIARPDLQCGDPEGARAMGRQLHTTLHQRVLALGDDVVLLPGHDHPGIRTAALAPTLGEARGRVPELAIDAADDFADAILADIPSRPVNYETVIAVNAGTHPFDPELETGGNSCSTR